MSGKQGFLVLLRYICYFSKTGEDVVKMLDLGVVVFHADIDVAVKLMTCVC